MPRPTLAPQMAPPGIGAHCSAAFGPAVEPLAGPTQQASDADAARRVSLPPRALPDMCRPQASIDLEFRTPHLGLGAPRSPLPSEGESSGAAAAVTAVVVGGGGVGGVGWLGAVAVDSSSVSGSGSGSRPGVLLRGPGGESCRIGLRPGTARDFFPIASPSASRKRRTAERGGSYAPRCVINIHTPRHRLLRGSAFNRRGARSRQHLRSFTFFYLRPLGGKGGLYP